MDESVRELLVECQVDNGIEDNFYLMDNPDWDESIIGVVLGDGTMSVVYSSERMEQKCIEEFDGEFTQAYEWMRSIPYYGGINKPVVLDFFECDEDEFYRQRMLEVAEDGYSEGMFLASAMNKFIVGYAEDMNTPDIGTWRIVYDRTKMENELGRERTRQIVEASSKTEDHPMFMIGMEELRGRYGRK